MQVRKTWLLSSLARPSSGSSSPPRCCSCRPGPSIGPRPGFPGRERHHRAHLGPHHRQARSGATGRAHEADAAEGAKAGWDKILLPIFFVLWLAQYVVAGLDAVRFELSHVPLWLKVVGALGVALGFYVFHVVMRTNTFAAPVVKIQTERKHQVISTGPYAYVRHPMYRRRHIPCPWHPIAARFLVRRRPRRREHCDPGAAGGARGGDTQA